MTDTAAARNAMVEGQVRVADVNDRALVAAMREVPRELFAPKAKRALAYGDVELQVGDGRWMLRPRDFAKLADALEIQPSDIVLNIACGRGYAAAVFARMAETVVALESDPDLVARATAALAEVEADNAAVMEGDLKAGAPDHGPFDVIFVDGGVEVTPDGWLEQLAEGGRLGVIVRAGPAGEARIYRKSGGAVGWRTLFDATPNVIPGFEKPKSFAF